MTKVLAFNYYKKLIPANKNNFDEKFDTLEKINNYLNTLKNNDCLIFYGDSIENILYNNNGILYNILKKCKKINVIEIYEDGKNDLLENELNIDNDIINTLKNIITNRSTNNSFIKIKKSHLFIKMTSDTKILYVLDLCISQKKKILHGINNVNFAFLNKSIENLKKVINENKHINDFDCNLLDTFKNIPINFVFIGLIGHDRDVNDLIYNFIKKNKLAKLPIIKEDDKLSIVSYKIPKTNLLEKNEEIKCNLESANKLLYRDSIMNFSLMSNYNENNIKEINDKIKMNIINTCEIILKNLKC
jgi:hypothetical protein